jgi:long-chain acyl-CoA synthetase
LDVLLQGIKSSVPFYLLSISSGNVLKLRDDCEAAKVTILVSVPRILNRIAETIKNKFIELKMPVFRHPAVFAKVRESFGGKLRMIATGSAPLSTEVTSYLEEAFGCPLIEGYGQTESSAGALFHRYGDPCLGSLSQLTVIDD